MIRDARLRACHLQRRLRPGLSILDRKSVHGSRAALQSVQVWTDILLTSSADPAFATSAG